MTDRLSTDQENQTETFTSLKPLLILGAGRNGSTLLMQLFGTSPQIVFDRVYPFEVRYLTYLLRWAHMLAQQFGGDGNAADNHAPPSQILGPLPYENAQLWNGEQMWPACFAAAWKEFSAVAVARMQGSMITETQPRYYAEKVGGWVPSYLERAMACNIILLVRDPRDMFLSISAFNRKRGYPGFGRLADDDDLTFAKRLINLWHHGFSHGLQVAANPSNILVRYEQLVLDLPYEAERLSRFLGVEFDVGVVEKQVSEFAHHMTSSSARESVGRWRRELSPELKELFLNEVGKELQYYGYET